MVPGGQDEARNVPLFAKNKTAKGRPPPIECQALKVCYAPKPKRKRDS